MAAAPSEIEDEEAADLLHRHAATSLEEHAGRAQGTIEDFDAATVVLNRPGLQGPARVGPIHIQVQEGQVIAVDLPK